MRLASVLATESACMNTKKTINPEDLSLLSFERERIVVQAMVDKEPMKVTATRFGVTTSRIQNIRRNALLHILQIKKIKKLKERDDKVGFYMLNIEEVFSGRVVCALKKYGWQRIGDIRGQSTTFLLRKVRGLGHGGCTEIRNFFTENGLEFQQDEVLQETFADRVTGYIWSKLHNSKRGFGPRSARVAADAVIESGLLTETQFQAILEAEKLARAEVVKSVDPTR